MVRIMFLSKRSYEEVLEQVAKRKKDRKKRNKERKKVCVRTVYTVFLCGTWLETSGLKSVF